MANDYGRSQTMVYWVILAGMVLDFAIHDMRTVSRLGGRFLLHSLARVALFGGTSYVDFALATSPSDTHLSDRPPF